MGSKNNQNIKGEIRMKTAFFICALKEADSPERKRSRYVQDNILTPALGDDFNILLPIDIPRNIITTDIVHNLKEADLVVCDITDLNPNVFYELGIRHMTGKPCIILRAGNSKDSIPFDIGAMNVIAYPYPNMNPISKDIELTKNEIRQSVEHIFRIYEHNKYCENIAFNREDKKGLHLLGRRIDLKVQDIIKTAFSRATEIDILSMTGETSTEALDIFKNNLLNTQSARIRIMALSPESNLVKARFSYIRNGNTKDFFDKATETKKKYQELKDTFSNNLEFRNAMNRQEASLCLKYYDDIPYFSYIRCDNILYIALYTATEVTRNSFVFYINSELNPEISNQFITQFERIWGSPKSKPVLTIDHIQ